MTVSFNNTPLPQKILGEYLKYGPLLLTDQFLSNIL